MTSLIWFIPIFISLNALISAWVGFLGFQLSPWLLLLSLILTLLSLKVGHYHHLKTPGVWAVQPRLQESTPIKGPTFEESLGHLPLAICHDPYAIRHLLFAICSVTFLFLLFALKNLVLPPGDDSLFHLDLVKKLLATGRLPVGTNYPAGMHLNLFLFASLFKLDMIATANLMAVVTVFLLSFFPFGFFLFVNQLFLDSRRSLPRMLRGGNDRYLAVCRDDSHWLAFFASISTIPFLPNFIHNFGMGSHPFLWGLFLTPFFLAGFIRWLNPEVEPSPGRKFNLLATILLAFGLFYTHPSWGITSALIIFFLLPVSLRLPESGMFSRDSGSQFFKRSDLIEAVRKLGLFTFLLFISLLPMLSSVINMLSARANIQPLSRQWTEWDSGRFNSLKEAFFALANLFQLRGNLFFTFMFGLGIVLTLRLIFLKRSDLPFGLRVEGRTFLISFFFIFLALVFIFFDAGYFNFFGRFYTLTQPWGFWHRVIKYFVFPLAIFSGVGLAFLWRIFMESKGHMKSKGVPRRYRRGTPYASRKIFFSFIVSIFITASLIISATDLNQYLRVFAPSRLDLKALLWAKNNLPPEAAVLNDTTTDGDISESRPVDGGAWLSVISGQKPLLGYLFQAEPDYAEKYNLLNHLSELETNPQILKLLNKFKVGYIYYSDCSFVDRRHMLSLNFLQNNRNFVELYEDNRICQNGAAGKVYIYRLD